MTCSLRASLSSAFALTLASLPPLHAGPASPQPDPASPTIAAHAINTLGLQLLQASSHEPGNALLSPYSIQTALAMTWAGAAGDTLEEMTRVLHFGDEPATHASFATLARQLEDVARQTATLVQAAKRSGGPSEPLTLTTANRLFGQKDFAFRETFQTLVRQTYGAPLQPVDFTGNLPEARRLINSWVEDQTRQRIRDLIPPDGLDRNTALVLVNAIYLKAAWASEFPTNATQPRPFLVGGRDPHPVPTMRLQANLGYSVQPGFKAVTLPFLGGDIHFLILLPDQPDGLPALERQLTSDVLARLARPAQANVALELPKLRLEPPLWRLAPSLQALGLKTAFDLPPGSANFDRMAPRRPNDYLAISEVFHKTFLALDERGAEAAAATAVSMVRITSAALPTPQPIVFRVDRPFLFAIQHAPSGACLFLGRLVDPR